MKAIKSFVIDRTVWLRGEGEQESRLLRPDDQKMCCLGIYLKACGAKEDDIHDRYGPQEVIKAPKWLLSEIDPLLPSVIAKSLMTTNDEEGMEESKREEMVYNLFLEAGVKVRFTGPTKPYTKP